MPRPNAPRVDAADRDAQALELRADGASYRQIAERLGVSISTAWTCVERGLDRTRREPADRLRVLEGERLDRLQDAAVQVLQARHVVVSGGKVVKGADGSPLVDHGPTLAAVRTLLAVQERRAKLFGLDAPVKVDAKLLTIDELDRQIAQVQAEMDALDRAEGRDPYERKRQEADKLVYELAAHAGWNVDERVQVHDRVLDFWKRWKDNQAAFRDVPAFVAAALETAVMILALPPDQHERLAGQIERFLMERTP
jgi:hypothetical protein